MNLQTPVILEKSNFDILHQSKLFLIGSCFSENIGAKLLENKFDIVVNPFGILYNPISISNAIKKIRDEYVFTKDDFILHNNLYHSLLHHGSFSNINLDEAVSSVNTELKHASYTLNQANLLLITFGTSYVFRWKKTGEVVGNCHKISSIQFQRERLTVEAIVREWTKLIEELLELNQDLKFIFTVSPIRHLKDGLHENQLSKATLHLAIDSLINKFPKNIFYFAAYEILMDQLRDYRFYADDMLHPSQIAQEYIWKRFSEVYFSDQTQQICFEWQKIRKSLFHKPHNQNTDTYKQFVHRTIQALETFELKYPSLSCTEEREHLTQLLKNLSFED